MRDHEQEGDSRRQRDRDVGRSVAPAEAARRARDLPVGGQRVRQARQPEHLPVHRHDQDRRGGRPDQVARGVHQPAGLEAVDHADHRRLYVAAAQGGLAVHDRHRHQGRRRDSHEQHERHAGDDEDHPPKAAPPDANLARQAGRRLDPDQRDRCHHGRKQRVLPAGRRAQVDGVDHRTRIPFLGKRDEGHRHEQAEAEEGQAQHHPEPVGRQPADVLHGDERDRERRDHDLDEAVVEIAPEDGEVVADRDRPDRHHDQVVEQDGPARDEAPQLVEGVTGKGGCATALRMERAALHVGGHRDHEEQARGEERERCQSERVAGHDPQHHEEPRYERAEQDREQGRFAKAASDARAGPPRSLGAAAHMGARAAPDRGAPLARLAPAHRPPPLANHRRAAPINASIVPRTTPSASAPPPRASVDTTIATPRPSSTALSTRVDARYARCTGLS